MAAIAAWTRAFMASRSGGGRGEAGRLSGLGSGNAPFVQDDVIGTGVAACALRLFCEFALSLASEIRAGLTDIAPPALAAIPIGLLFGALAAGQGPGRRSRPC